MPSCLIYGRKKYRKFDQFREEIKEILVELIENYHANEFFVEFKGMFGQKCIEILNELSEKYTFKIHYSLNSRPLNNVLVSDMILAAIWEREKTGAQLLNYAWKFKKLNLNIYNFFIERTGKKRKTLDDYIQRQNTMKEAKSFLRLQQRIFQMEETEKAAQSCV